MAYLGNSPGVASQRVVTQFTATSGQTTFTPQSGYTIGYLDVFLNGVKLVNGDDYTASDGTSITLISAASLGDSVELVSFTPRGLSDGWLKAEADSRYLQLNTSFSGDVTGTYSATTLANSGATAGTYGSSSAVPQITVDAKGRITSVSSVDISSLGDTVISSSGTSAALRITQTGTGNALLVEDSTNPDATPFVIDASGNTVIGDTGLRTGPYGLQPIAQVSGAALNTSSGLFVDWANNDTTGPALLFAKAKSGLRGTQGAVVNGTRLFFQTFSGSDGTNFIPAAQIEAAVDGTPGTNDMPGRLTFSTTADGASSPTERMRIDNQGRVGIGATPSASTSLRLGKNITGGTSAYGVYQEAQVQSATVTNVAYGFQNVASVSAGGSLSEYRHFDSYQGTLGITPTNQYSFYVNSNLTGATNNYGFYSNIASGSGRWNFYANGTADNYFAGRVGIGATAGGDTTLNVAKNITGAVTAYGVRSIGTIQSDVTTTAYSFISNPSTVAAAFTLSGGLQHFTAVQGTIGAGSAIANQFGFHATSFLTGATNNYGFYSDIASGTGRWNFYANGTAANFLAGKLGINADPTTNSSRLIIGGTVTEGAFSSAFGFAGTFGNGVSNRADSYVSFPSVNNTTGTLPALNHFYASQNTFSTTVTSQYGYFAASSLTGATNNIGFYSDIASGTGRWNFYANGTANNYFNGSVGIGDVPVAGYKTLVTGSWSGSTTFYGVASQGTAQSDVTSTVNAFRAAPNTATTAFTLTTMNGYLAEGGTVGAGSTVTNLIGFQAAANLTGGTNNYGFHSNISSGTGRWNFYAGGTASNYFNGNVGIGTTPSYKLDVYGGSLGTTAGNQILAQQLRVATVNDDKLEFSKIRISNGADWTTAGWRLQQKVDATWHGYIQFNGNNNEGISFGTGGSTVSANSITERMRIDSAGNVGIGNTSLTGWSLRVSKNITGGTSGFGVGSDGSIQSGVTSAARMFISQPSTAAASFTLSILDHYLASQGTIGAGSIVTSQYGFNASSSLIGATNNYGFVSDIPSGTGRWNFYAGGTADNYFDGRVGIGGFPESDAKLVVGGTLPSNANSSKAYVASFFVPGSSTNTAYGFLTYTNTSATAFTLSNLYHYVATQGTVGAGSTVTNQYGFTVSSNLTGATNNYGFYSNIASGTGRWNFYAGGTANNYFAGNVAIGTTSPAFKLDVIGNASIGNNQLGSNIYETLAIGERPSGDGYASLGFYPEAGNFVAKIDVVNSDNTFNIWANKNSTQGNRFTVALGVATEYVDLKPRAQNVLRVQSDGTTHRVGINTTSPGSTLDVKGTIRLSGATSGYVDFAPAAAAGATTYTLPTSDGTAGQALSTNGSGTLYWATGARIVAFGYNLIFGT